MPGIAGLISQRPSRECQHLVEQMLGCMQHEDFYTSGTYSVPEWGIFAGWMAHEGSFADCQPVLNEQQDISLIFSGECFSDPQDRTLLGQRGHQFEGNNASWLVHLYEEKSAQFFAELNGFFSGLLIDKRQRRVFLFNDRYGMERIYYHARKDGFFFASEAKALLRILPELRTFDEEGVAQFLTFGCTLEWKTLFRGVNLLPGASLWRFDGEKWQQKRYFLSTAWETQPTLSAVSFATQFEETFRRILPRYFESDSEIGISLTGGLDTRMIMACLPVRVAPLVCYTFGGEREETLDVQLAAQVASACGLPHHILRLGPDFFTNFASLADRTVYITDGCFGICGAHEIYLNRQARGLAPVRLTGNFGSEVLRGMSTFKPVELSDDLFTLEFRRHLEGVKAEVKQEHPVAFAAFQEIPWNLFGSLAAGRSQVHFRTPYLDNTLMALAFQSPEECRMSSLLALHLVRMNQPQLASIPTDRGQTDEKPAPATALRHLLCDATFKLNYLYNEGMPHWLGRFDPLLRHVNSALSVFGQHKYLHYRSWFRRELAPYTNDRLSDAYVMQNPWWNAKFLQDIATRHASGYKNYLREINAVITIEAIDRLLLRQSAE